MQNKKEIALFFLNRVANHPSLSGNKGSGGCKTCGFSNQESPRQTETNWSPYSQKIQEELTLNRLEIRKSERRH